MDTDRDILLSYFLRIVGGDPNEANVYIAGLCNGVRLMAADPELARWLAGTLEGAIASAHGIVAEQTEHANRVAVAELATLCRTVKES